MTVAELLTRISSREMSEWIAYYGIEPWGAERDNLHAGIVASTTANLWRGEADEPLKASDFMLRFEEEEREPATAGDLYDMFHTWALLNGAKAHADDAEDAGSQADR